MSELRYNVVSRDWVVIATERARRPDSFKRPAKKEDALPEYKKDCPFCPGNEGDGHDETYRLVDKDTWKVRSIRNKYPAFSPEVKEERRISGIHNSITGYGMHEVIVENRAHNKIIALMTDGEVEDIIRTYRERYIYAEAVEGIEAVTIFKNHGPGAGCSQEHPHSQFIATPITPPQTRVRLEQAAEFFDVTGKCIFCRMAEDELTAKERMVLETDKFAAFCPYASFMPFVVWLFPKRHAASFADIDEDEIRGLARALKTILRKIYAGLGNPDLNYVIRSVPVKEKDVEYFHW
ncbi:MAG: galactose-1-phosphate uridylyltransferase, partial [Candidatus Omnitrophica bacterium]|nr:galactose-1-phosphate uridylyltransferase [Candidatus Omnitrophota bacterium]